jgi:hypothetical protein
MKEDDDLPEELNEVEVPEEFSTPEEKPLRVRREIDSLMRLICKDCR